MPSSPRVGPRGPKELAWTPTEDKQCSNQFGTYWESTRFDQSTLYLEGCTPYLFIGSRNSSDFVLGILKASQFSHCCGEETSCKTQCPPLNRLTVFGKLYIYIDMNISSDSGKRTITLGERGQWLATSAFEQFSVISKGHIPISSDSPRQRHLPKLILSQFQPTPNSHQRTRKLKTGHTPSYIGGWGWVRGRDLQKQQTRWKWTCRRRWKQSFHWDVPRHGLEGKAPCHAVPYTPLSPEPPRLLTWLAHIAASGSPGCPVPLQTS